MIDLEKWKERFDKENKQTGDILLKRILREQNPKRKIKSLRNDYRWKKRIIKLLKKQKKFIVSNWECFDQGGRWLENSDVQFKLNGKWRWVFTIDDKDGYQHMLKDIEKHGGELHALLPKDNAEKFDYITFDKVEMKNGEDYVKYIREWVKIFFPDMVDKIEFVEEMN